MNNPRTFDIARGFRKLRGLLNVLFTLFGVPSMLFARLYVVVLILGSSLADASEWTRFRGPNGAGVNEAAEIPVEWKDENILFRTKLPGGTGAGSPVIWNDKAFVLALIRRRQLAIWFVSMRCKAASFGRRNIHRSSITCILAAVTHPARQQLTKIACMWPGPLLNTQC